MLWVVIFGLLALAALAVLVGYAVWLAHKTADVFGELAELAERAGQLGDLLAQIRVPDPAGLDFPRVERAAAVPE
jgi:hypothetical protein